MDSSLEINNKVLASKEYVDQNSIVFEKVLSELESIQKSLKIPYLKTFLTMVKLITHFLKNSNMKLTDLLGLKHIDFL